MCHAFFSSCHQSVIQYNSLMMPTVVWASVPTRPSESWWGRTRNRARIHESLLPAGCRGEGRLSYQDYSALSFTYQIKAEEPQGTLWHFSHYPTSPSFSRSGRFLKHVRLSAECSALSFKYFFFRISVQTRRINRWRSCSAFQIRFTSNSKANQ